MKNLSALLVFMAATPLFAQLTIQLEPFISGLSQPIAIRHAEDDRIFIVERRGAIRIVSAEGQLSPQAFLDIDTRVSPPNGERGLLGLAFHPDYAGNGYFFVNYTNNQGNTVIARFSRKPDNANEADPNSEKILLTINQPFSNHNGGDLAFGPDGYLYIPMGDGGDGGDPQNFAQNRQSLLGKMLRINVNEGDPYSIPPNNPFLGSATTADEIWGLGLRNPWRFSFDRLTGDIWIGDVGQGNWEEINMQAANSQGGENYGWRCYEGNANFNLNGCTDRSDYTFPVHVYTSDDAFGAGCSVTGGYVYRGPEFPALFGHYIYADYCSGRFWSLRSDGQGGWINTELLNGSNFNFATFGEDQEGNLYVAGLTDGTVYKITTDAVSASGEVSAIGKVSISPNPTNDLIQVEIQPNRPATYQIRLIDAAARTLQLFEIEVNSTISRQISMRHLPAGVYVLQVQKGKEILSKKIQKN